MNEVFDKHPIRIPVKLVDQKWEYFYGGMIPVAEGAVGDLVVDKSAIRDPHFLAKLKRSTKHKILECGTSLLVALTIRRDVMLADGLDNHLQPQGNLAPSLGQAYYYKRRSPETRFVRITIGGPTERQKRDDPTERGGVWLYLEGLQPKGVSTSTVCLPENVSKEPAESLNHAFTLLSEKYEPWRKSHTGNIYERVLYQEANTKWYPLEVLRNAAIAQDELHFVREQWNQICRQLNIATPS